MHLKVNETILLFLLFQAWTRNGKRQAKSPNYCVGRSVLTLSVPEKMKNSIIEIPIILQTLDVKH